jgi:hypothetical protein
VQSILALAVAKLQHPPQVVTTENWRLRGYASIFGAGSQSQTLEKVWYQVVAFKVSISERKVVLWPSAAASLDFLILQNSKAYRIDASAHVPAGRWGPQLDIRGYRSAELADLGQGLRSIFAPVS